MQFFNMNTVFRPVLSSILDYDGTMWIIILIQVGNSGLGKTGLGERELFLTVLSETE